MTYAAEECRTARESGTVEVMDAVFRKTILGYNEAEHHHVLSRPQLRRLLDLIDGEQGMDALLPFFRPSELGELITELLNLGLIEDGEGVVIVDTGYGDPPTWRMWEATLAGLLAGLGEDLASGRLATDVVASLYRVMFGYGLACALGVPCGLVLGHAPLARAALLPGVNRKLKPGVIGLGSSAVCRALAKPAVTLPCCRKYCTP